MILIECDQHSRGFFDVSLIRYDVTSVLKWPCKTPKKRRSKPYNLMIDMNGHKSIFKRYLTCKKDTLLNYDDKQRIKSLFSAC